ncbi:MAG: M81 family metallopeptidase [Planctomycetaceae bacterium]|nr:M81 family metallopeptidase [Planctomycetales bacterium]MCB9925455.1 M81 family metallopeptidase [Planctomycetaceae bacterium]
MSTILIGELKQETATFNPAPTTYDDFSVHIGSEMIDAFRATKTELAGVIDAFGVAKIQVAPTLSASAVSGGPIVQADLTRLVDEMLRRAGELRNIDGLYLCLHGAMAGEEEDDPEGLLLTRLREIFPDRPIVASLDLHAVLTDRMIEATDILVPYHTYPHTDHYETGQRAARNLIDLLDGAIHPTVARVKLPMLVRGDELLTATGLFGQAIRMCQEIESTDGGLAAGVFIGNAFTDVPSLQSNVLVATNGDLLQAQTKADRIGRFMWEHRKAFQAKLIPLDEAIAQANRTQGLVVFSDAADATASGAAGDSNAILRGLLESGFRKRAIVPIVDAPAVEQAFAAGVGATISTKLGGTRDTSRFSPLSVAATVTSLHQDPFQYEDGTTARNDRAGVLTIGSVTVLVTERPVYVVGRRVFECHGVNPIDFDLVVVKSPNGFRTWYESIAELIVPVDVPGSTSANLRSLPFKNCVRPIFPLDEQVPSPFESSES